MKFYNKYFLFLVIQACFFVDIYSQDCYLDTNKYNSLVDTLKIEYDCDYSLSKKQYLKILKINQIKKNIYRKYTYKTVKINKDIYTIVLFRLKTTTKKIDISEYLGAENPLYGRFVSHDRYLVLVYSLLPFNSSADNKKEIVNRINFLINKLLIYLEVD